LEAWAECRPDGMTLAEELVPQLLPNIAVLVPGGLETPESARRLNELFNSQAPVGGAPPVFLQMLKPRRGQVHFLYFWQAFSEAAKLVAGGGSTSSSAQPRDTQGRLDVELEQLRDRVLQRIEAQKTEQLSTVVLVDEVHSSASSSGLPGYWREVLEGLGALEQIQALNLEELTAVMIAWLHDASSWLELQNRSAASQGGAASRADRGKSADRRDLEEKGIPVYLHVYDVSQEESVQKLNKVLAHRHSPLKFGGVFHCGVEVNGLEWCYGFSSQETLPGVCCVEPKAHPQHHYRQTVRLKRTLLSAERIAEIVGNLLEEYPGDDYDLLRRNCCHFSDDFCQRIGVGSIPGWVHRLARIGASLDGVVQVAQGLNNRFRKSLYGEGPALQDETYGDHMHDSDDD